MPLIPVPDSAELRRVLALPTRQWSKEAALALAEQWSPQLLNDYGKQLWAHCARLAPAAREAELKRLGKEGTPIRMKPEQAIALYEFVTNRGLALSGPVGVGKTLLGYLIALCGHLYFGTCRPVVFCPGSITDDTRRAYVGFTRVWQMPRPMPKVVSYEALGMPQNEFMLCDCRACTRGEVSPTDQSLCPDLRIADESDILRNPKSSRSKRWDRQYLNHVPISASLTGTPVRKSLRNIQRPLLWALGPDRMPLPADYFELDYWCSAVDESPREGYHAPPGALLQFCGVTKDQWEQFDEETRLEIVRRGLGERIAATPGVVVIDESSCDQPVHVSVVEVPVDPGIDRAFHDFRKTGCTPDGWRIGDIFSQIRHGGNLGRGFYSRWNPRPPESWIDARNAWKAHVAERIEDSQRSGRPIDSEGVVARLDVDSEVYQNWKAEKEAFGDPNVEAIPISYAPLAWAAQWLKVNGPALCWVKESWVGEALSQMTGIPYFAGEGKTRSGYAIGNHPPTKSAILSVNANRRGRNLQGWNRNLVFGVEHSAERNEQMLGRTHRYGQERPVYVVYAVSCAEDFQALDAALSEARNAEHVGKIRQKLLHAETFDWQVTEGALKPWTLTQINPGACARWSRASASKEARERAQAR